MPVTLMLRHHARGVPVQLAVFVDDEQDGEILLGEPLLLELAISLLHPQVEQLHECDSFGHGRRDQLHVRPIAQAEPLHPLAVEDENAKSAVGGFNGVPDERHSLLAS